MWNNAENALRKVLDDIGIEYTEEIGEAAFYGSPRVAGHVTRQRYVQSQFFTEPFKFVIDQMSGILVLPAPIRIHVLYYRQQVGTPVRTIFVDNLLHRPFPFDEKQLSRLLPAV